MAKLSPTDWMRQASLLDLVCKSLTSWGILKVLLALLLFANIRSVPFAWHIRVFSPLIRFKARYYFFKARNVLKFGSAWRRAKANYYEALCPIGSSPFDHEYVHKGYASFDDCDFYGHLSNSSYAKSLDAVRLELAVKYLPHFPRAGGWLALAATHYHFIREIPRFAEYEIRISCVAWDEKWAFLAARFVTKPKTEKTASPSFEADKKSSNTPQSEFEPSSNGTNTDITRALAMKIASQSEPDGATLHCVAISQTCLKHGRITVPPGLVYASHGCYRTLPGTSASEARRYSHNDPPPHWKHTQPKITAGGNMSDLVKFWRGGWRNVPEGERWWIDALGGEIELKRSENMKVFANLKSSLENAGGVTRV